MSGAASNNRGSLTVTVYGTPAPQGSKNVNRYGATYESSIKVKPWREAVKWAVNDQHGQAVQNFDPFSGPVVVELVFTLAKPASAPKRTRTWPARRPDLDKLVRATLDGICESGVIRNDGQVVELTAAKRYPHEGLFALDRPGAWIRITEVAE